MRASMIQTLSWMTASPAFAVKDEDPARELRKYQHPGLFSTVLDYPLESLTALSLVLAGGNLARLGIRQLPLYFDQKIDKSVRRNLFLKGGANLAAGALAIGAAATVTGISPLRFSHEHLGYPSLIAGLAVAGLGLYYSQKELSKY